VCNSSGLSLNQCFCIHPPPHSKDYEAGQNALTARIVEASKLLKEVRWLAG
jgi:magnesium chelatase subunit I